MWDRARSTCTSVLLMLALGGALPAGAASLGFSCITANLEADCAVGEAQLRVEVFPDGADRVRFELVNTGSADSSITQIYFDLGGLDLFGPIASIDDGDPGVRFSTLATPGNLPGGNPAGFQVTVLAATPLSAGAEPAVQPNGVNPGESLGLILPLSVTATFGAVELAFSSGDLRLGVHVQGYASGGSESFVSSSVSLPEPGSSALLALGLLAWSVSARASRSRLRLERVVASAKRL